MLSPDEKQQILQQEWEQQQSEIPSAPLFKPSSAQRAQKVIESKERVPDEFRQLITMQVSNLPLSAILGPIRQATGYNVIFGPGVEDKKLSLHVVDVPISRALNTLMYASGYGYRAQNKDLILLAQETRIFRIVLPPIQQKFHDVTSNESFVQSTDRALSGVSQTPQQIKLGTKVLVENSASDISFWDDVQSNLKTLLSPSGQFSLNKPAGSVIVTDAPSYIDRIAQYFEDLNRRVVQQMIVDVKVLEVVLDDENKFGVDWNVLAQDLKVLNSVGLATNFASGNFSGGQFLSFRANGAREGSGLSASGFKVALDALSKQGKVEVVSQPRVTLLNNQLAVIQVGSTQSFVDKTTFEATQTGTITSISTSQVQEGITMRLLGNMVGDDIYLSVTPVVTTIDNIRSIASGTSVIEAPQTSTKSIHTLVKLSEGETIAIGGLISSVKAHSVESVPVLSKVPFLGRLFRFEQNKNNKTELIMLITPKRG